MAHKGGIKKPCTKGLCRERSLGFVRHVGILTEPIGLSKFCTSPREAWGRLKNQDLLTRRSVEHYYFVHTGVLATGYYSLVPKCLSSTQHPKTNLNV